MNSLETFLNSMAKVIRNELLEYSTLSKSMSYWMNYIPHIRKTVFPYEYYMSSDVDARIALSNASIILDYAFYSASLLNAGTAKPLYVGTYAFENCNVSTRIYLSMARYIGERAFYSAKFSSTEGITLNGIISESAFAYASIGKSIQGNISSIPSYAFYRISIYNSQYRSVKLPECTYVGYSAFYSTNIQYFTANSEASTIANYAFYNNLSLLRATMASTIGSGAFAYCYNLSTQDYLSKVQYIGSSAFDNNYSMHQMNLPECTYVGSLAFRSCYSGTSSYRKNFTMISLPKCSYIGNSAFYQDGALRSVYLLGSSVTKLGGSSVFYGCPASVYVPASLYSDYLSATYWSSIYSTRLISVS